MEMNVMLFLFRDVLSQSVILDCLFPNDRGLDTPNLANHYQLKRLG